MENKQLFFSHTWRPDNLGRNTHTRVYDVVKQLRDNGWTTWFDEEDMGGNIDAAMADGIDNAEAILVCLTETYCKKVNETAKNPRNRDNCLKEWTYANARNKLLIPVIMEPCLLNPSDWPPGIVSLYLGSTLYIDATKEDLNTAVIFTNKFLLKHGLQPRNKVSKDFFKAITHTIMNKKTSPVPKSPSRSPSKSPSRSPSKSPPKSPSKSSPKSSPKSPSKLPKSPSKSSPKSPSKSSPKSPSKLPRPPQSIRSPTSKSNKSTFRSRRFKNVKTNINHRSPPPLPQLIQKEQKKLKAQEEQKKLKAQEEQIIIESPKKEVSLALRNKYMALYSKPPISINRRISEINVFSNNIPKQSLKKSISTGNFNNLYI